MRRGAREGWRQRPGQAERRQAAGSGGILCWRAGTAQGLLHSPDLYTVPQSSGRGGGGGVGRGSRRPGRPHTPARVRPLQTINRSPPQRPSPPSGGSAASVPTWRHQLPGPERGEAGTQLGEWAGRVQPVAAAGPQFSHCLAPSRPAVVLRAAMRGGWGANRAPRPIDRAGQAN